MSDQPGNAAAQEVRHIAFNPTPYGLNGPLGPICAAQEAEGWRLVQVVPHHQYESVAVFVRGGTDGE